jgi:hypothetical protein
LIVALSELEPSSGIILFVNTPQRPDLRYISRRVNNKVIRQLTKKRSTAWSSTDIDLLDSDSLINAVSQQTERAMAADAAVILFPYGPKASIFIASFVLAKLYPSASWFVYPIPYGYMVDYSDGVERVVWMEVSML